MSAEKVALENLVEKGNSPKKVKSYGWGIRHVQVACMMFNLVTLFVVRASMGIAVLAMSDVRRSDSTDIEVFDWDKRTQSMILASFFWGYLIMQIPGGILARRFGGKPTLTFAILANGIICLLMPSLASWGGWMLVCAGRAVIGLTQAFLFPATQTLLGQWLPANERTSCIGIVFGGAKVGTIAAMALCGVLAESSIGWKLIFYTMYAILLVNLAIWYFLSASSPREHRWISEEERKYIEADLNLSESKRKPSTPWKQILKSKPVWALLAPHFGFAITTVFFLVDMPTYLDKGLGISLKSSSLLSAFPYIGMLFGSTTAAFVSEQLCNRGLITLTTCRKLFQSIALFGTAAGMVVLSFLDSENTLLVVLTLVACLTMIGCSTAGCVVNQLDLSPNYAGVIMSLLNFVATAGCAVIPIVTSTILQNDPTNVGGWHIVFLLIAVICTFTAIIFIIFATSERQPWDDFNYLHKKLTNADIYLSKMECAGSTLF